MSYTPDSSYIKRINYNADAAIDNRIARSTTPDSAIHGPKTLAFTMLPGLLLLGLVMVAAGCEKPTNSSPSSSEFQGVEARLAARGWAYAFDLPMVGGGTYSLREKRGRVVLVHFWATWCAPCLEELPALNKIYEKYRERGLEIAAVSVDEERDGKKVEQLATKLKLTMPIVLAAASDLPDQYAVEEYPTTLFVNRTGLHLPLADPTRAGAKRYRFANARDWTSPEYEALIESALQASE